MSLSRLAARAALIAPLLLCAPAAEAGIGDLLVAPTRIVLNGSRGTEILLNNIGEDVATYRISVELRRMTPDGMLHDVTDPNAAEQTAQSMIVRAPSVPGTRLNRHRSAASTVAQKSTTLGCRPRWLPRRTCRTKTSTGAMSAT